MSDNVDSKQLHGIYAIPTGAHTHNGWEKASITAHLNHNCQIKFTFDYRSQVDVFFIKIKYHLYCVFAFAFEQAKKNIG